MHHRILLILRVHVPAQPVSVAAQRQPLSPKHSQPWLQSQLNNAREKSIASAVLTAHVSTPLLSSPEGLGGSVWRTSTVGLARLGNTFRKAKSLRWTLHDCQGAISACRKFSIIVSIPQATQWWISASVSRISKASRPEGRRILEKYSAEKK